MSLKQTFRRRAWLAPLLVIGGAAVVRVAYLVVYGSRLPFLRHPVGDALIYAEWARAIAGSDFSGSTVFYRAPLYPYLLALGLKLGAGPLVVAVVQMALGLATAFVVFLTGRRLFGDRAGLVSMALCGLSGPLVMFESKLLSATLVVLLVTLGAWFVMLAGDRRHHWYWLLSGLCFGLAATAWAGAGLVFAAICAWALLGRAAGHKAVPLGVVACVAVVGIVTLRNAVVGQDFVPISANGGFTFYQGNNRLAAGTLAQPPEVFEFRHDGRLLTAVTEQERFEQLYAESVAARSLRPSQVSSFWMRRALSWMAHNPGSFAVLLGRKLVLALSDYESPSDYNIELEARHVWPLRVAFVRFGLLLALAVAGVFVARPRPAWPLYAVAAGTLLALLVFYVADRYRLPAYPALALLAGAGIDGLWRKARARRSILAPVAAGLAAFALSAVAFTLPLRRGSDLLLAGAYRNLGATLAFRGDRPGAVAACQQAQAIYDRYAATLNRQERLTASELSGLLEGLSPRVDAVEAASALLRQADTAAAIQQLEAGINRNPTARDAYLLLGSLLGTRGEHARARSLFGDAVARFPNDLVLRYNLALAALNAGDHQTALTNAEAVLKQVPDHPWARKVVERARAGLR